MTHQVPVFLRLRRWWLLPLSVWLLATLLSFQSHIGELRQHNLDLAGAALQRMFHMIVLTRSWNAQHGRVYVPVSATTPSNPYLEHPKRDVTTLEGERLTMVNPAYMTRQLAELAHRDDQVAFHITSLKPIRPTNAADAWETLALQAFERGEKERLEIVAQPSGEPLLRYMAPLEVKPPCLACHAKQGYRVGDIRGGISVSMSYAPILAATGMAERREIFTHAVVFLLVSLVSWGLLELLRRRWLDLSAQSGVLLDTSRELADMNRSLAEARDAAETASQAKSAFLATMSHELRTPLNGILGMAGLLRASTLTADQHRHVDTLRRSGNTLLGLVNDVLEYTRMESTPIALQETVFPVTGLIEDIVSHYQDQARAKGLTLESRYDGPSDSRIRTDYRQLRHILAKLVENGIKFTDQGRVSLNISLRPGQAGRTLLRAEVSDTGIGMNGATFDRLFRPFELADASTTRRHGGIGLGLAIAQRRAKALGGVIRATSQPGLGSTFTLELDLASLAPEVPDGLNTPVDLESLIKLLDEDDIQARDVFANQSDSLRARLGEAEHETLAGLIANYRYAEAAELLRKH